jgi:hypothetical protein
MHISRGFKRADEEAAAGVDVPEPKTLEYHLMHDRLVSLERLAALRDRGVLSEPEFAAEKERILRLPGEELILRPGAARGPSLLARLLGWKVIALGALLGLGLGLFAQPQGVQALEPLLQSLTAP